MKGRKPNLTVIEGGSTRENCPSPAPWMHEHAKAEWWRAAPDLHARKLLSPDVSSTLESYCVAVGIMRECEEIMAREGRMIKVKGEMKIHPAYKIQSSSMREARLLATELGLTPHRKGQPKKEPGKNDGQWEFDLLA